MPLLPNGEWVPGPNDYHVNAQGVLQSGLGPDEPDTKQRRKIGAGAEARLLALREEVAAESEKIAKREETLTEREAALDRREAALKAREKGGKKGATAPKSDGLDDGEEFPDVEG
jgi:hypothetical protein